MLVLVPPVPPDTENSSMSEEKDIISCRICDERAINELQCSVCKYALHFYCALGFTVPDEPRETLNFAEFKCPICVVGAHYELLHRALDSHRIQSSDPQRSRLPSPIAKRNDTILETYGETEPRANASDDDTELLDLENTRREVTSGSGLPTQPIVSEETKLKSLRQPCISKVKNLSYILRSLHSNLPGHATTLFIGDSLQKGLVKKDIDSVADSVRIRSVGGLCVVATTMALSQHKRPHPKIKKVVFTLGINDCLHSASHHQEETNRYFKGLEVEASRVFPNATLHFVLPYKGMVSRDASSFQQSDLQNILKEQCPKIRRHIPPNLKGKVNDGGIHPSEAGNNTLTKWYSKTFVPPPTRVFNRNSGRKSPGRPYSQAHIPPDTTASAPIVNYAPSHHPPSRDQCSPDYGGLAGETPLDTLSAFTAFNAFSQMMKMWGKQPSFTNSFQPQQWPPRRNKR